MITAVVLFLLTSFLIGWIFQNHQKETYTEDKPEPKKEGFFEKKFSRRSLFTLSYLREF